MGQSILKDRSVQQTRAHVCAKQRLETKIILKNECLAANIETPENERKSLEEICDRGPIQFPFSAKLQFQRTCRDRRRTLKFKLIFQTEMKNQLEIVFNLSI